MGQAPVTTCRRHLHRDCGVAVIVFGFCFLLFTRVWSVAEESGNARRIPLEEKWVETSPKAPVNSHTLVLQLVLVVISVWNV
mmetsp:Transcript_17590/g.47597  ORF Transcript_17590/g.47597 Transcript_17590/m.47597 type:complete len:82 (-) Transcript_17590:99-344(-)